VLASDGDAGLIQLRELAWGYSSWNYQVFRCTLQRLASCEKTISTEQNFDGLHVLDKSDPSGYLVHLVILLQPDKPNRSHEQNRLADFFSILPALIVTILQTSARSQAVTPRSGALR